METLINNTPNMIFAELHVEKSFTSSSTISLATTPWRYSLPLSNSEVDLRIETAQTKLPPIGDAVWQPRPNIIVRIGEMKKSILASTFSEDEKPMKENEAGDEEESLVNYDEGHVLVPGLTAQLITEEELAEELHKLILDNSLNEDGGINEDL